MDAARGPPPSVGLPPRQSTTPSRRLLSSGSTSPPTRAHHQQLWLVAALTVASPAEDSPSGLWRTIGNRVGVDSPSRVQIPHPPPPTSMNADYHDRMVPGVHAATRCQGLILGLSCPLSQATLPTDACESAQRHTPGSPPKSRRRDRPSTNQEQYEGYGHSSEGAGQHQHGGSTVTDATIEPRDVMADRSITRWGFLSRRAVASACLREGLAPGRIVSLAVHSVMVG